jgi:beta-phosphoglucomutase
MKAIIFDLDGVIISTDHLHYQSWKMIADKEGLLFNESMNHQMRGISRSDSLEILIKQSSKAYTPLEKEQLMHEKNEYYKKLLTSLSKEMIMEGILEVIAHAKQHNIKLAIGSSSKNAKFILEKIGLLDVFDVIVDGNDITWSKPNPEVFLKASERLNIPSDLCCVVEDAHAGIEAAKLAHMKAFAVGDAMHSSLKDGDFKDLLILLNM